MARYALDVLVAHAPCNVLHDSEKNGSSNNKQWSRTLVKGVHRSHNPRVGLVRGIDANGKVGSCECDADGGLAAERKNDNGFKQKIEAQSPEYLPQHNGRRKGPSMCTTANQTRCSP